MVLLLEHAMEVVCGHRQAEIARAAFAAPPGFAIGIIVADPLDMAARTVMTSGGADVACHGFGERQPRAHRIGMVDHQLADRCFAFIDRPGPEMPCGFLDGLRHSLDCVTGHPLGDVEPHAMAGRGRRGFGGWVGVRLFCGLLHWRRQGRFLAQRVIDLPALSPGQFFDRAFGHCGDRQQRIDAHRPGQRRPVANVEPFVHLGSARPGEHAAGIVDHAMRGIVTHPAATDRMDGDQLLAERIAPQGIGEILRIDCARGFGHAVVVAPETALFAGLGPMDRKPVVFECELPTRIVDAHHQIGLRTRHRPFVCPLRDASRIGLNRFAHRLGIEQARLDLVHAEPREPISQRLSKEECRRERGGNDPRGDTFLDNQPVGDILGSPHVDHAGNAGPRIGILRDIRSANANRIEGLRSQRIALFFSP